MRKFFKWFTFFMLTLLTVGETSDYLFGHVSDFLELDKHPRSKIVFFVAAGLIVVAHFVTELVHRDNFPDEERKNRHLQRLLRSAFIHIVAGLGGRKWYETCFVLGEKRQAPFWWSSKTLVRIDNLATLIARGDQIRTYFADCPKQQQLEVSIEIDEGYLVDRFLLWGIMDDFKNEWQPIVAEHNFHMQQTTGILGQFESFRRSQFICWLLWGPSIPACDCALWQSHHRHTGEYPERVAWQFGFGDENNSVFLCLTHAQMQDLPHVPGQVHRVADSRFTVMNPDAEVIEKSVNLLASRAEIRQQAKRLYLFSEKTQDIHLDDAGGFYYTAYMWIMFVCVLLPEDGKTEMSFCTSEGIRNRSDTLGHESMLPFFVHANIYDQAQVLDYQEMLIAQTLAAFQKLFRKHGDGHAALPRDDVIFVYAGASDDSRHGRNANPRIRRLLEQKLACASNRDLAHRIRTIDTLLKGPDLDANRHIRANLDGLLTPCRFSDYFQGYYESVQKLRESSLAES